MSIKLKLCKTVLLYVPDIQTNQKKMLTIVILINKSMLSHVFKALQLSNEANHLLAGRLKNLEVSNT